MGVRQEKEEQEEHEEEEYMEEKGEEKEKKCKWRNVNEKKNSNKLVKTELQSDWM